MFEDLKEKTKLLYAELEGYVVCDISNSKYHVLPHFYTPRSRAEDFHEL